MTSDPFPVELLTWTLPDSSFRSVAQFSPLPSFSLPSSLPQSGVNFPAEFLRGSGSVGGSFGRFGSQFPHNLHLSLSRTSGFSGLLELGCLSEGRVVVGFYFNSVETIQFFLLIHSTKSICRSHQLKYSLIGIDSVL